MQDIEKFALQYLLYSPEAIKEFIAEGIDDTFFYNSTSKTVARTMFTHYATYGVPISREILKMQLLKLQVPQAIVDEYLAVNSEDYMGSETKWYMDELRTHKKTKKMQDGVQELLLRLNSGDSPNAEQALKDLNTDVAKLNVNKKLFSNLNEEVRDMVSQLQVPRTEKAILTGYPEFDDAVEGFRPGWLVLVAALPKIGKTRLLINMSCGFAKKKVNVLVFSMEISKAQYNSLCLSCMAKIPARSIEKHQLTPQEIQKLNEVTGLMEHEYGALHVVDTMGSASPTEIQGWIQKQEQELGIEYDVVLIDYGNMVTADRPTGKDHLDQAQVAYDLKNLARRMEKVFLVAVQRKNDEQRTRKAFKNKDEDQPDAGGEAIGRSFVWYQAADIIAIIQNERPDDLAISTLKFKLVSRFGPGTTFALIKDYNTTSVLSIKDNPNMKGLFEDNSLG